MENRVIFFQGKADDFILAMTKIGSISSIPIKVTRWSKESRIMLSKVEGCKFGFVIKSLKKCKN